MIVKLLTEHHLEFLSLKEGGRGSSESTLIKMSNCWKSHALAPLTIQRSKCVYTLIGFVFVQMIIPRNQRHERIQGRGGGRGSRLPTSSWKIYRLL